MARVLRPDQAHWHGACLVRFCCPSRWQEGEYRTAAARRRPPRCHGRCTVGPGRLEPPTLAHPRTHSHQHTHVPPTHTLTHTPTQVRTHPHTHTHTHGLGAEQQRLAHPLTPGRPCDAGRAWATLTGSQTITVCVTRLILSPTTSRDTHPILCFNVLSNYQLEVDSDNSLASSFKLTRKSAMIFYGSLKTEHNLNFGTSMGNS